MAEIQEGALLGMGNPLLDIVATVEPEFLDKYGMKSNDAILAGDAHVPMYQDLVSKYSVEYIAGGATQNALRAAQWIIGKSHVATFMGGIGNDEFGKVLSSAAEGDGVNVRYQILDNQPTGTCAVLLTGKHRSLCAYLAAANHFTKDHLEKPENFAYVEKAQFYYISGYFLTVSPDSILTVASYAASNNRPFTMNLSAPFISQFFGDRLNSIVPYIDILFGNETEARAFSVLQKFDTEDVTEIAQKTATLPKINDRRQRMIVFTQGSDPVIVVQDNKVHQFPVKHLTPDEIKDTNGAGDAFVGGFLAQYIQGKDLATCIKCGIWVATEVIKRSGCTFPKEKKFSEESN